MHHLAHLDSINKRHRRRFVFVGRKRANGSREAKKEKARRASRA
jgi:hypothetical protein